MKPNTALRSEPCLPAAGCARPQPPRRPAGARRCAPAPAALPARQGASATGREGGRSARCGAAAAEAPEASPAAPLPGLDVQEAQPDGTRVQLRVTVPAAHAKKAWDKALRKAASGLNVPGFRPGKKIPESVLFQYVSEEDVKRDAVTSLFNNSVKQVTGDYKERAFGQSFRLDDEGEALLAAFSPSTDLTYSVSFEIAPEVKWSGDYSQLKVEVEQPCPPGTAERLAEGQLQLAIKEAARLRIVSGRGLQQGDVAVIDFEARERGAGEPIAGTKREGMQVDTTIADNTLGLPGLAEAIVGMGVGESKTLPLEIPDTWWDAERRGTTVDADVTVRELFQWDLPELDDALAQRLLPSCTGADDLKEQLLGSARIVCAKQQAEAVNLALTMAVADLVDVEVPEALVRELGQNEYQAQLLEAQTRGGLDMAAVEQLATEEMLNMFIENRREELTKLQKGILGFDAIFSERGLAITEEEVAKEVEAAAQEAAASGEEMDLELLQEQVTEVLKAAKVLEWLTDNVEITLKDAAPEAEEAAAA